jgi:hypothetical protein
MSVAGGEPAEGEVLQSHILDGEHALCSECQGNGNLTQLALSGLGTFFRSHRPER